MQTGWRRYHANRVELRDVHGFWAHDNKENLLQEEEEREEEQVDGFYRFLNCTITFDRVNWDFLMSIMTNMGFGVK
ncbi:hypothetical protein Tco_1141063 [Tanacetum coccineum]